MRKKIILRGAIGGPVGILIGYIITIVSSLIWAESGYYSPCVPELIAQAGSEINAVLLQTALCTVLGATFGAASVIWEIENWNIVKQTGLYFLITCAVMMLVAYCLHWMEHSVAGFLLYFGIFAVLFFMIWLIQYVCIRYSIRRINANLK